MPDSDLKLKIGSVKLFISDVDGVLTDGSIYISSDGQESKRFSVEDGAGAALAHLSRLPVAFISGRYSEASAIRLKEMRIEHVFQGSLNKTIPFEHLLQIFNLTPKQVAYMGDGLVDIPVMERCGFKIAPPNSHPLVLKLADYITNSRGGFGAFREAVEIILKGQDKYDDVLANMKEKIYLKNS